MPRTLSEHTDEAVLAELGHRFERERINRNITQRDLAERCGIGLRTLRKLEAGEGTTMRTFIALLRGLGWLDRLEQMIPEPALSPVELANLKGKQRQRASGIRSQSEDHAAQESRETWIWDD